ncbi:response regulator transcription factor [Paraburkholderia sp. BL10I2N1]|uniref:response regulator transcription factor n=1 Tax=Paraburkholderia sp. BL10I2N1 TaxID=1938796 RepID=UPI00105CF313|nr:response regulator transcription factor [Paraburkholderia sp. BL10I2N1]TDN70892.1 LuxR family two component transcriptional regulator [Paraburkholderia sp. BL10I2N1]
MRFSVLNSEAERREGLKALLRQIDRQARFSEAQDWRQADRTLRRLRPDLLVIDWEDWMRISDARALFAAHPALPVAVLTDDASPATVRGLIDEGVLGVIPRGTNPDVIVRAFEMALLGSHYVPAGALALESPPAPGVPARRPNTGNQKPPRRTRLTGGLSPRQEQIMRCVHMGSTNKMIARTLGISEGTVKIHLASIFQQLGAPNRAAAVAIYNGWLASQLEVLRSGEECTPRPALGQTGAVPLRLRANRRFKYPLPANDAGGAVATAAEPTTPFGEPPPWSAQ